MARTVLVTGASGLLGRQVLRAFELDGWKAIGTALNRVNPPSIIKLDLVGDGEIERVLDDVKPDVVVHCAANRFPDSCSADPDAANKLNVSATKSLAKAAFSRGTFLIYISTDYVFSGQPGEAPYKITSTPNPPNVYGQTKLDGEKAVLEVGDNTSTTPPPVVLRVPILYGHSEDPKESAVNILVSQVWASQDVQSPEAKIKVDDYAQRYPTNTEDVARVCRDIADRYLEPKSSTADIPRILQFSSEDKMTKYDMCKVFAEILGFPTDGIAPDKPNEDATSAVKRPYDCHLDTSVLKDLGIPIHTTDFKTWWRREMGAFRH